MYSLWAWIGVAVVLAAALYLVYLVLEIYVLPGIPVRGVLT